eukprot:scaffold1046_cov162-Ochromonas_danica.AAC.9
MHRQPTNTGKSGSTACSLLMQSKWPAGSAGAKACSKRIPDTRFLPNGSSRGTSLGSAKSQNNAREVVPSRCRKARPREKKASKAAV